MKILITGSAGQLGWELQRTCPDNIELAAFDLPELDVSDIDLIRQYVKNEQPEWIINASAYTAVDKAEGDSDLAYLVNAEGAKNLAIVAKENNIRLLHVSTDFVFDGSQGAPYLPDDAVNPKSVYGASKLQGDQAVQEILADDALIIRTAWVYSAHGNNFVKTMLRLMNERNEMGVVEDQIGTPTWAAELAKVIYLAIEKDLRGMHHWTDAGAASWYDFSEAIYQLGRNMEMIDHEVQINPIPTEEYPTPAARPANSVLDKNSLRGALGYTGMHWRAALENVLKELKHGE